MNSLLRLTALCLFIIACSCVSTADKQKKIVCWNNMNDLDHAGLKGKVKTVFETSYDSSQNKEVTSNDTTTYNELGYILSLSMHHKEGDLVQYFFYKYNQNGKVTEITIESKIDSAFYKNLFTYDSAGILVATEYFKNGVIQKRNKFEYTHGGNPVEYTYDSINTLTNKTVYTLNNRGNLLAEEETYDARSDNMIKETATTYKYDAQNNPIEIIFHLENVFIGTNRYKHSLFDKNNNWLKEVCHKPDSTVTITERKIEYYH